MLAYGGIVVLLRITGKRTLSKMNAFDFIVTVALGSTLGSILTSKGVSLAQGLLAFALLVVLQLIVTWLATRVTWFDRLLKAQPTLLVRDGHILEDALTSSRVTHGEILAAVRGRGLVRLADVAAVVLETDGSFSVLQRSDGRPPPEHSAPRDVRGAGATAPGIRRRPAEQERLRGVAAFTRTGHARPVPPGNMAGWAGGIGLAPPARMIIARRVLASLVGGCLLATPSLAGDRLLLGRRLLVRDSGRTSRTVFESRDGILRVPSGPGAPTVSGMRFQILNPVSGKSATFDLPASRWNGNRFGTKYTYRDRRGKSGPVLSAVFRNGRKLRVVMESTGISISDGSQGALAIVMTGGDERYCSLFAPASIRRDVPCRFVAGKSARPLACPAGAMATSGTSPAS